MEQIFGDKFGEFQQFFGEFWSKPSGHTVQGSVFFYRLQLHRWSRLLYKRNH